MKRNIILISLLFFCAMGAQAQIVGATNGSSLGRDSNKSTYRQKGGFLKFEAGIPISLVYDYQTNPYLSFGGGIGYRFPYQQNLSVFGEITASTPLQKWGFFADARLGLGRNINWADTFPYVGFSVGARLWNFRLGAGVQTTSYYHNYDDYHETYFFYMVYLSYSLSLKKLY